MGRRRARVKRARRAPTPTAASKLGFVQAGTDSETCLRLEAQMKGDESEALSRMLRAASQVYTDAEPKDPPRLGTEWPASSWDSFWMSIPRKLKRKDEEGDKDEDEDDEDDEDEEVDKEKKAQTSEDPDIKSRRAQVAKMNKEEKAYYLSQGDQEQQGILALLEEARTLRSSMPLRFRVLRSRLPGDMKHSIASKLGKQSDLIVSSEAQKYNAWVEVLLSLPLGTVLIPRAMPSEDRARALHWARDHLDRVVYGHAEAKAAIIERFYQCLVSPLTPQRPLALVGVPGNGKTTLMREGMAAIMGRPFSFVALGGSFDSSFLLGHSYTYEGSGPGRLADCVVSAKCMNPIVYFDELDKCSKTPKGDEVSNVLVHLTDPAQNDRFHDRYLGSVELDLSRALLVFTYNDPAGISPILLDRLQVVGTDAFDTSAQASIVQRHLLPRVLSEMGLPHGRIMVSAEAASSLARRASDGGVRCLRGALERAASKVCLWAETGDPNYLKPLKPSSIRAVAEGHELVGDVGVLISDTGACGKPPLGMYS